MARRLFGGLVGNPRDAELPLQERQLGQVELARHSTDHGPHAFPLGDVLDLRRNGIDEDAGGDAIEEAELVMVDDIRRFIGGVQGCQVRMTSWGQSQQIDLPFGWVSAELEIGPFNFDIGPDETLLNNFTTLATDYDIAPHVSAAEHIKWLSGNYAISAPELKDQITP